MLLKIQNVCMVAIVKGCGGDSPPMQFTDEGIYVHCQKVCGIKLMMIM